MESGSDSTVAIKNTNRKPGPGRPKTLGIVKKMAFNLDDELEAALEDEHSIRRQKYIDVDWTKSGTIRQLLREAIAAARAVRARNTPQPTSPELTTIKS